MADKSYDILIEIRATQAQVIQQLQQGMASVRKEAEGFNNAFKIGGAVEVARLIGDQLREIPSRLLEAVKAGVEFNALLEQSRLGVAGVLRQFDPASYKDFNAALTDSDRIIGLLRQKANQLGLSFESMLEQYRTTANALFAGGVRDLQKQVDLTVLLQQAMASLGISGFQAQRDIFDLLEGRSARTIAGRALGITDADIEKAKEAGTLGEFLTTKFQAIAESGRAIGSTFGAAEQRARNLVQQLEGVATTDAFNILKAQLNDLNELLARPETAEKTRGIATAFLTLVEDGKLGVSAIIDAVKAIDHFLVVPEKIFELESKLLGLPFKDAYDIGQVAQFVDANSRIQNSILTQVQGATEFRQQQEARRVLDDAILAAQKHLETSSDSTREHAEQFLHSLEIIRDLFPDIAGSAERVSRAMTLSAEQADKVIKAATTRQDFRAKTVSLIPSDDPEQKFRDELEQTRVTLQRAGQEAGGDPVQVARDVHERLEAIILAHQKEIDAQKESLQLSEQEKQAVIERAAGNTDLANASERDVKIRKEFNDLLAAGETDQEKAWQLATDNVDAQEKIKNAKQGERDVQKELNALMQQESNVLKDIRLQQKLISESPFIGVNEKQTQLHALFLQEQQQLAPEIAKVQKALEGAYGPLSEEQVAKLTEKLRELRGEVTELGFKIEITTFTGGLQKSLTDWANSFGTSASQIGNLITGGINQSLQATNTLLLDAAFRTGNWKQTVVGLERSLLNMFLTTLEQMAIQAITSKIHTTTNAATQAGANATIAASAAPAAAATSIATSGWSAIAGEIAAVAAIGAIIALLSGSFEEGGLTGGSSGRIAGVVHGKEYVQPERTVNKYGADLFEAFRQGQIPVEQARALVDHMSIPVSSSIGAFEAGGLVGPGSINLGDSLGSPKIEILHFMDPNKLAEHITKSDAGIIGIVDAVNGNSHLIRRRA